MSLRRYPRYKESNLEWFSDVPEHWAITPLKRMLAAPVTDGPHTTPSFIDQGVPFLSVDGIQAGELRFDNCRFISAEDHAEFRRKALPTRGDLLMGKAASTGKIARVKVDFEFSIWSPLALIRIDPSAARDAYVEHALKSPFCQAQIEMLCTANTQKNISMDEIPRIVLPLPPLTEQAVIGAFCEAEAAKIDAAVTEYEQIIALLNEKRQAVISHAVTKGLNPNAPMRPSGLEWFGDVPAHWKVTRLKAVIDSVKAGPFGSSLTKDMYVNAGYRVYGQEQVIPADFTVGEYFITAEKFSELQQYRVVAGDVLISCVGTFGQVAVVPQNAGPGIINPRLIRMRCSGMVDIQYFVEVMRSAVTFEQMSSFSRGGTMDVINIGTLSNIYIPLPPKEEQRTQLTFIRSQIETFDALTAEAQRAIDLLQERRSAIISAAVTGAIDVRGLEEADVA